MEPGSPPDSFRPFYDEIDIQIRAGDFMGARHALKTLADVRDFAREEGPWVAELYRRAGLSEFGLRLLFRYVHPSESEAARVRATPHELAEYGGCLVRLYAIREAERVLARLPDTDPRKFYFLGFARIHEWDYAGALAHLRRCEELMGASLSSTTSTYTSLIARVNIADCLVETGDAAAARPYLEACRRDARSSDAKLLEANTLELIAKNHVLAGEPSEARRAIAAARSFLGDEANGSADAFFLERLERILALRAGEPDAREKLADLRERARHANQFETARDADLHLAEFDRDEYRFHHLYYGTPFSAYRDKIATSARKCGIEISDRFFYHITGKTKRASRFTTRDPFIPTDTFKPGALLDRLFRGLTADLYRPRRVLELHEAAYPGQIFNPRSSRDQLHQGMRRLRKDLLKHRLPFAVHEERETYALVTEASATVLLRAGTDSDRPYREKLAALEPSFSAREVAERLGCSKNTAISVLNRLLEGQWIMRTGEGPLTRYTLNRDLHQS